MAPSATQLLEAAQRALHVGDAAQAIRLCAPLVDLPQVGADALMLLGEAHLRTGRRQEALVAFERAAVLVPGNGLPFTRIATIRLREALGDPPPPRRPDGRPRIQFTRLGSYGRFGNQLLQYGFLRLYAAKFGLSIECPDWIGRDLFDLDDPLPGGPLPELSEDEADLLGSLRGARAEIHAERDIRGYFCAPMADWGPVAAAFRAVFRLGRRVRPLIATARERLRARGRTVVAVHLRRGDFGIGPFWIAPVRWYLDWVADLWPALEQPVLYVATDDPALVAEFAAFAPVSAADLGVEIPGAPFLVDFEMLRDADRLAISNSTFSFDAALLNERATTFVRPDPDLGRLRAFEPWQERIVLDPTPAPGLIADDAVEFLRRFTERNPFAVYVGDPCSAFVHEFRRLLPRVRLTEIDAAADFDAWRTQPPGRHVSLAVFERPALLPDFAADRAPRTLGCARIDFLLVCGALPGSPELAPLADHGYVWHGLRAGAIAPLETSAPVAVRSLVAVHARLLPLFARREGASLPLADLCRTLGIKVRTVVHVGAHEGQAIDVYRTLDAGRVVFIEANPAVQARLAERFRDHPMVTTVCRAVSDSNGPATLHLTSPDRSSSLLPMARHRQFFPHVVPAGTQAVQATTLDHLLAELGIDAASVDLLAIEAQGAERQVLEGASAVLRQVPAVRVEVAFADLYVGGGQIESVDEVLRAAGLQPVALVSTHHQAWAEALYVRDPRRPG